MNLRVALVVPDMGIDWNESSHCRYDELEAACHEGKLDLVVLPEAYEVVASDEMEEWVIDNLYACLKVPILIGLTSEEGFQVAIYVNPKSSGSDSRRHLYVKHSTADRVAFDWPGYAGGADRMFEPIVLGDARIGVQICHDMFYGLVGQQLRHHGANLYIDLTGGDVDERKWRNVLAGRSLELSAPFLCTMAKLDENRGKARAFALDRGRDLEPTYATVNARGFAGFEVFDLGDRRPVSRILDQAFTDKHYTEITINRSRSANADIHARLTDGNLILEGHELKPVGRWRVFRTNAGPLGILPLPVSALGDGLAIHRHDVPQGTFPHHVVAYYGQPNDQDEAMALMKLRAIEHRVGVLLVGEDAIECIKTHRYKNIQRFRERDGVFGLNAEFLGGTRSTARAASTRGVSRRYFEDYLALQPY